MDVSVPNAWECMEKLYVDTFNLISPYVRVFTISRITYFQRLP